MPTKCIISDSVVRIKCHVTYRELCRGEVSAVGINEKFHPEGKQFLLRLV